MAALATIAQLRKMLRTVGTVSAGADVDEELLQACLDAASERVIGELPERTLDVHPALVAGEDDELVDEADPVTLRIPLWRPRRTVQVPDLREVTSIEVAPLQPASVIDLPELSALPGSYVLRRRPRQTCALWLQASSAIVGSELVITGRWGPAEHREGEPLEVNAALREAVLVWAARAWHNRTARFADSVQEPSSGAIANYFRNLPADVATTLNALRIPGL